MSDQAKVLENKNLVRNSLKYLDSSHFCFEFGFLLTFPGLDSDFLTLIPKDFEFQKEKKKTF